MIAADFQMFDLEAVYIQKQIEELKRGVQVVVGTPGRIIDHIDRRTLNLSSVSVVVLDEADRMLDMGFLPDIRKILGETPKSRQTSLFSATLDRNVLNLSREFMHHPLKIIVNHLFRLIGFNWKTVNQFVDSIRKLMRLNYIIKCFNLAIHV
jgi:superfamily II DNA/RNA helicase